MKLIGAVASHVGNVRNANQDRVFYRGQVAALADGMGGHQGGERAAELAIGEFELAGQHLNAGQLVDIVQEANRQVHVVATADAGLTGMGTTLVALTLHDDNTITVANVGDSRAYWLRGDYLGQVTTDHSFVEDLVRQGRLTPEEAAIHPQRNILTRAIGIGAEVEVDRFPITEPMVGDRFLLCSDGLFNEVPEEEIARILTRTVDPSETAEALVTAALATPCRDNVSVAVVDIVEDNDPAVVNRDEGDTVTLSRNRGRQGTSNPTQQIPVVTGAVLHEPTNGSSPDPDTASPESDPVTAESAQASRNRAPTLLLDEDADRAEVENGTDYDDPELYKDTAEMEAVDDPVDVKPRGGRKVLVALCSLVVLGAVGAAGFFFARSWAQAGFFLDENEGQLSLYEGKRDGLFGFFAPSPVEATGIQFDELTNDERSQVAGSEFETKEDANNLVVAIRERQAAEEDEADGESGVGTAATAEPDESQTSEGNTDGTSTDSTDTLTSSTTDGSTTTGG